MRPRPSPSRHEAPSEPLRPLPALLALIGAGQVLFWSAWWLGYRWLPEGALQGKAMAANLPLEALPLLPRMAAIFLWNALWAAAFAGAANLLRIRRLPLGFVPVLALWTLYGLFLGTNSFSTPLPVRPAPSPELALQRAGVFELTAYTLMAGATVNLARWRQEGWLTGRVRRLTPLPLQRQNWVLLALAAVLLAGAAIRETLAWCGQTGGC